MDAKKILIAMVMVNLLVVFISSMCLSSGSSCGFDNNLLIPKFFVLDETTDFGEAGSLRIVSSFQSTVSAMLTPQAAGAKVTEGFSLFLDAVRMTLGVLTLLTPLPILDLLNGFSIPMVIILPLTLAIFYGYFLGLVEILRGASFGK